MVDAVEAPSWCAETLADVADWSPEDAFAWLIRPVAIETFFKEYWEKRPLHISRQGATCPRLLTLELINKEVAKKPGLQFEKDLNLAQCVKGKQVMRNGSGRVTPAAVSRAVAEGCSVQVNVRTWQRNLWTLEPQVSLS